MNKPIVKSSSIVDFVRESNRIENIHRSPTPVELEETGKFLKLEVPTVGALSEFVFNTTGVQIRSKEGRDVFVGNYHPPKGGSHIVDELNDIIKAVFENSDTPFILHRRYESLHPFMDGNGRSGRLLWAWQMLEHDWSGGLSLGFLRMWYYQSLSASRDNRAAFLQELPLLLEGHEGKWVIYSGGKRIDEFFDSDIDAHEYCEDEVYVDRYIRNVRKQAKQTIGFEVQ